MDNEQEKDLNKLESEAASAEFVPTQTTAPVKEKEPTQAALQIAGYVVMGANVACGILAAKRGKHWLLKDGELQELHKAVARVAEKYMVIDMNNPLYALAAVAGAIFIPRMAAEFMSAEKTINGGADGDQSEHQVAE
ncbi:MAG: hypothetical protein AAGC78_10375 [Cellvibrio sp.]|uniref:hypothetical protein n=1 Tax=Cellvibrio sp. TaxID=1965322 RepID=UPI0031B1329B